VTISHANEIEHPKNEMVRRSPDYSAGVAIGSGDNVSLLGGLDVTSSAPRAKDPGHDLPAVLR